LPQISTSKVVSSHKKYLGLDVGGSATRWCYSHDSTLTSGETAGFSGHLSRPDVLERATKALEDIANKTGDVGAVVAGVTGLSKATAEAVQLEQLIRRCLRSDNVYLMSDIELATRAAFPHNNGILVYAGTGSIAAHLNAAGNLQSAGGKGVLIDDAGGGYWIAVAGMRHVLRAEDALPGSGWQTPLGQAMAKRIGGTDWPQVRTAFYGLDRGGIALLAIAVGEAADLGDTSALEIMRDAGSELGFLAQKLMIRTQCRDIALAGRASMLHRNIVEGMQQVLPDVRVRAVSLNCARTALNLAQDIHDLAGKPKV
jgi:glucosamine kinase